MYDPLGWLAPVIVQAKLLVQQLWVEKIDWDQRLPVGKNLTPNYQQLKKFVSTVGCIKQNANVVYAKSVNNGKVYITLLQAKSKVAPIKSKVTIPRLELCSAQLLAKLLAKIRKTLKIDMEFVYAWSDSMIALAWIRNTTNKWETFVANRVAEINRNIPHTGWQHVRTHENPADQISRGISPEKMSKNELWWNGPTWLKDDKTMWPTQPTYETNTPSGAKQVCTVLIAKNDIVERFSSLHKMIRVLTYCRRFGKTNQQGPIRFIELQATLLSIIKKVQEDEFSSEIKLINKGETVCKSSPIRTLNPIKDQDGILCVGGRLQHSNLTYRQQHPILLPANHHLSRLIIEDAHFATLHGGIESTLAYIRRKYWIPKAKDGIRATIRKCTKCIRYRAATVEQIMGQLPKPRVTPSRPFTHSGVDYAGPINIRTSKGRGHKSFKGYIAIFICLATKAIHIEIVSDLTTNTFLAAYRRFSSRRGTCNHMYSNNGTTFVGAAKQLKLDVKAIEESSEVQDYMAKIGTNWHFIPAVSPHFGGLWEAGVKSIKYHLKRQIGDSTLTFEELTTLTCQIEACLNSRPLYASNNDQNEHDIITAGHFLIGSALIGPPNPVTTNINGSMAERWQLIQRMKKDFWKAWTAEYLTRLQHQYKWTKASDNLKTGTVVIMKENDINPANWPLARIIEVHPGSDEKVRVVTLKGRQGRTYKRAVVNLIPLPNDDATEQREKSQQSVTNMVRVSYQKDKAPKPRRSLMRILAILWLLITTAAAQYTVEKVDSGVYVEHLGEVEINTGTFRMQAAFAKEKIDMDIKAAEEIDEHFAEICKDVKAKNYAAECTALQHHLEAQTKKLDWIKHDLGHIQSRHRQRRGLLGTVLTSVFGVNDEVYRDIDTLDKNQRQLIKTSHQQSNIIVRQRQQKRSQLPLPPSSHDLQLDDV